MLSFLNWHEYVIVITHPSSLRALNHTDTYEIDTLLQISDNCWHLDNPDFMIFTLQPWRHPFYRKKRDFCLICEKPVTQTVTINRHINKPASPMSKLSNHAEKALKCHTLGTPLLCIVLYYSVIRKTQIPCDISARKRSWWKISQGIEAKNRTFWWLGYNSG